MDFVKNWWLWLALTVVVVILLAIRFTVISSYIEEAEENADELQDNIERVEKDLRAIRSGKFPTAGDVKQAEGLLAAIQAEGDKTKALWQRTTTGMDVMHSDKPRTEFVIKMLRRCYRMIAANGEAIAKTRNEDAAAYNAFVEALLAERDDLDASLVEQREPIDFEDSRPVFCRVEDFKLVGEEDKFGTMAETLPVWRKYLITRRVMEIAGLARATLPESKVLVYLAVADDEENKTPKPLRVTRPRIRTLDFIDKLEFSPPFRGNFDKVPEGDDDDDDEDEDDYRRRRDSSTEDKMEGAFPAEYIGDKVRYHDIYPIEVNLVGHLAVVRDFMQRMLAGAGREGKADMLFVPRSLAIRPFDVDETKPGASARDAVAKDADVVTEVPDFPLPLRREPVSVALEVDNEPPVRATLSYHVYHFRGLRDTEPNEADGEE